MLEREQSRAQVGPRAAVARLLYHWAMAWPGVAAVALGVAWGVASGTVSPVFGAAASPDMAKDLDRVRGKSVTQGRVCSDPARPCGDDFKPNELSFEIVTKFAFDRGEDRSKPFFAIILESGPLCGIPDVKRVEVQSLFPGRKVFLHRYFCEDFGDNVGYTNVNKKVGFLAVYGGDTAAEAKRALAEVKATGRFPAANVRRMQVYVTYQLE